MKNIWKHSKSTVGQGDDYTTGCLLDYNYLNKYYKMIAIDLSKQQALEADPIVIQKINFTGNLSWKNVQGQDINTNTTTFFITKEGKESILDFSQGAVKVMSMLWYNLARITKVFGCTAWSKILFCFTVMSVISI